MLLRRTLQVSKHWSSLVSTYHAKIPDRSMSQGGMKWEFLSNLLIISMFYSHGVSRVWFLLFPFADFLTSLSKFCKFFAHPSRPARLSCWLCRDVVEDKVIYLKFQVIPKLKNIPYQSLHVSNPFVAGVAIWHILFGGIWDQKDMSFLVSFVTFLFLLYSHYYL